MSVHKGGACWQCARRLEAENYARSESCPQCGTDTRVCRNCLNFDAKSASECREAAAEPVRDRTRANYCEHFNPASPKPAGKAETGKKDDAKAAFEKLFGKKADGR